MNRDPRRSLVSIALPVYQGAETVTPVIESVLAQTHHNLELVISDNASTDGTEEICREFARADSRVVYRRHPRNVGLLNNFTGAAALATGDYLRWIGDSDSIEPTYVQRALEAFAEEPRRVLVTTQITYVDDDGTETTDRGYVPAALSSSDPVERLAEMLRLLTGDYASLDPLYGVLRRDVATMPRRNMLREDQIFAARLALAGPWGHVAAPLAHRRRHEDSAFDLARLLDVPAWQRHVRALLQCRELNHWIARSPLAPIQRRRAQAEVLRMYARGKRNTALRGAAKLRSAAALPRPLAPEASR